MAPPNLEITDISGVSTPIAVGIVGGTVIFVVVTLLAAYLFLRRRSSFSRNRDLQLRQFLLPENIKPVIGFKTAVGPGGLKKSRSPVQSPDSPEQRGLIERSAKSGSEGILQDNGCAIEKSALTQNGEKCKFDRTGDNGGTHSAALGNTKICKGVNVHGGEGTKNGTVNFTMRYNLDKNALIVTIGNAANLQLQLEEGSDRGHVSPIVGLDPYIKLELLPDRQHRAKTRVVKNTQNPVYDEEFTFYGINYDQLERTTVHLTAISFDRFSPDQVIGEVLRPLSSVDLSNSEKEIALSMPLTMKNLKPQNNSRGELLLSLCYEPTKDKLRCMVLKAKNLPKIGVPGLADPYVKLYLVCNGHRIQKKKGQVKRRTLDPVYNETFTFDLPSNGNPEIMDKLGLELYMMNWDPLARNKVIGIVQVGKVVPSRAGRSHWKEIRNCPKKQLADWHHIRPITI